MLSAGVLNLIIQILEASKRALVLTYPSRRWAAFSVPRAPKRARPDLYYPLKSAS
jgi:hypothetical protein